MWTIWTLPASVPTYIHSEPHEYDIQVGLNKKYEMSLITVHKDTCMNILVQAASLE